MTKAAARQRSRAGAWSVVRGSAARLLSSLTQPRQRLVPGGRRPRRLAGLVFGFSCLLCLGAVFGRHGYFERRKYEAESERLRIEIAQLTAENERKRSGIRELETNPAAIERIAREKLGWGRPGEVLIYLPEAAPAPELSTSNP